MHLQDEQRTVIKPCGFNWVDNLLLLISWKELKENIKEKVENHLPGKTDKIVRMIIVSKDTQTSFIISQQIIDGLRKS